MLDPSSVWPKSTIALAVAAALSLSASACGGSEGGDGLPVLWEAPDFAFVDQTGDTLRSGDLEGTAWVAHFFFASCEGVCPTTTARMKALRDSLAAGGLLGERVRLVSMSVDPARDTASALRAYARRYGDPPPSEWAFLTGSPPDSVRKILEEGFKVTASPPPPGADTTAGYQVNHSPRLEVVDSKGRVRATHDATEPGTVRAVLADLRALLR